MRDSFFAADEREHFGAGVNYDIEAPLHPLRTRGAVSGSPNVARILVIGRVPRGSDHCLYNVIRSGRVGVSDTQRDHVDALRRLQCLLPVDLSE